MIYWKYVVPVIALGAILVTLATLGFCGDSCGFIGNYFQIQHYSLHSQSLILSYSAVSAMGLTSLFLPRFYRETKDQIIDKDDKAIALLFQILREDERRVLKAITEAGGHSTQREISRSTNLTRLKTHRVVMRLQERGLVTAERRGRVSDVSLPSWLVSQIKDN